MCVPIPSDRACSFPSFLGPLSSLRPRLIPVILALYSVARLNHDGTMTITITSARPGVLSRSLCFSAFDFRLHVLGRISFVPEPTMDFN